MYTGVSNLASQMQMARTNTQSKLAMNSAGQEVASGLKSDLIKATGGDYGPLFAIERSISQLEMRGQSIRDASARAAAGQLNMAQVQSTLADYGTPLLGAVELNNQAQAFSIASSARGALDRMVSALNGRYGGQSLFAGAAVDGPALADAATIYADVRALTMAAADSTAAIAAIDDYFFNPAGGFATSGFLGAAQDAPGAELAEGEVVHPNLRADDIAVRQALRNVTMAAIASNGDHGGSALDGMNMLKEAAQGAVSAEDGLISLREALGHVEEQITTAGARNTAARSALEIERNGIIAADPYEAATRFQALQGQMEAVYLMTSRLSGLRLQNYLR